jgi:transposase InsO family protein
MKIEHIVADPHSPQTPGKVERLNQTVQRELLNKSHFSGYEDACRSIETYFHHYNYERPHQGIAGEKRGQAKKSQSVLPPAAKGGSFEKPPPWESPAKRFYRWSSGFLFTKAEPPGYTGPQKTKMYSRSAKSI